MTCLLASAKASEFVEEVQANTFNVKVKSTNGKDMEVCIPWFDATCIS